MACVLYSYLQILENFVCIDSDDSDHCVDFVSFSQKISDWLKNWNFSDLLKKNLKLISTTSIITYILSLTKLQFDDKMMKFETECDMIETFEKKIFLTLKKNFLSISYNFRLVLIIFAGKKII